MKHFSALLVFSFLFSTVHAQDCTSNVKLVLKNTSNGQFHAGQTVELTALSDGTKFTAISNAQGEVQFSLPCDGRYNVAISNYGDKDQIVSPAHHNAGSTRTYSYSADMLQKREAFAMDEAEKANVDKAIQLLPDTTRVKGPIMQQPRDMNNYATYDITLTGLKKEFLVGEEITFLGQRRKKAIKATTGSQGSVRVYLPKGDDYMVNFKYHANYKVEEVAFSKGTTNIRVEINYMGTKEYLRRKKEEEERMMQERAAAAAALARESAEYDSDKVIEIVMNRNKWTDKLLISDVSSEMYPYAMKLAMWYDSHRTAGTRTQFVLYYNGTKKAGSESGCAYYMESPNLDKLKEMIKMVHDNRDLDKAELDIKGLITDKGIQHPYKDVILFVDKDAGLHDYAYFRQLKAPVHIVLCVDQRCPNPQHLTIAWKTKGSVHSISGDYKLGHLVEGDTFKMEGYTYKIMGGEFVLM